MADNTQASAAAAAAADTVEATAAPAAASASASASPPPPASTSNIDTEASETLDAAEAASSNTAEQKSNNNLGPDADQQDVTDTKDAAADKDIDTEREMETQAQQQQPHEEKNRASQEAEDTTAPETMAEVEHAPVEGVAGGANTVDSEAGERHHSPADADDVVTDPDASTAHDEDSQHQHHQEEQHQQQQQHQQLSPSPPSSPPPQDVEIQSFPREVDKALLLKRRQQHYVPPKMLVTPVDCVVMAETTPAKPGMCHQSVQTMITSAPPLRFDPESHAVIDDPETSETVEVMKRYSRLLRRVFDHYSRRDTTDHSADAQKFLSLSEFEAMAREFALLPGVAEVEDLRDVFAASTRQENSRLSFRDFVECLTRLALTVYRSSDRFESSEQKLSSLFRAMHLDCKDIVLHRLRKSPPTTETETSTAPTSLGPFVQQDLDDEVEKIFDAFAVSEASSPSFSSVQKRVLDVSEPSANQFGSMSKHVKATMELVRDHTDDMNARSATYNRSNPRARAHARLALGPALNEPNFPQQQHQQHQQQPHPMAMPVPMAHMSYAQSLPQMPLMQFPMQQQQQQQQQMWYPDYEAQGENAGRGYAARFEQQRHLHDLEEERLAAAATGGGTRAGTGKSKPSGRRPQDASSGKHAGRKPGAASDPPTTTNKKTPRTRSAKSAGKGAIASSSAAAVDHHPSLSVLAKSPTKTNTRSIDKKKRSVRKQTERATTLKESKPTAPPRSVQRQRQKQKQHTVPLPNESRHQNQSSSYATGGEMNRAQQISETERQKAAERESRHLAGLSRRHEYQLERGLAHIPSYPSYSVPAYYSQPPPPSQHHQQQQYADMRLY